MTRPAVRKMWAKDLLGGWECPGRMVLAVSKRPRKKDGRDEYLPVAMLDLRSEAVERTVEQMAEAICKCWHGSMVDHPVWRKEAKAALSALLQLRKHKP